jgi:hypothetical protein
MSNDHFDRATILVKRTFRPNDHFGQTIISVRSSFDEKWFQSNEWSYAIFGQMSFLVKGFFSENQMSVKMNESTFGQPNISFKDPFDPTIALIKQSFRPNIFSVKN